MCYDNGGEEYLKKSEDQLPLTDKQLKESEELKKASEGKSETERGS
ncbi:hypothetical protein LEP1GSC096_0147 [Leptospira interrogans serovar Hebdomadis str. R499]|nr:hypothetical protein LEP1GSC096_0147 [Leptospira interrogans serovar Hebdomadis str. R499]